MSRKERKKIIHALARPVTDLFLIQHRLIEPLLYGLGIGEKEKENLILLRTGSVSGRDKNVIKW